MSDPRLSVAGAGGRFAQPAPVLLVLGNLVVWASAASMIPLALLLFVREQTSSLSTASLVLASYTLARAVVAPWQGRLVDRHGARVVLPRQTLMQAAGLIVLVVTARSTHVAPFLMAAAFAFGCCGPSLIPVGRNLLNERTRSAPDLRRKALTALNLVQEIGLVIGPAVAGLLVTAGSGVLGLVLGTVISAIAVLTVAAQDAGAAVSHAGAREMKPMRWSAGTAALISIGLWLGIAFGAIDVCATALGVEHGSQATAGLLLAAFAAGSGSGALALTLSDRWSITARSTIGSALGSAVFLAPLLAVSTVPLIAVLLFASGACLSLVIAAPFQLIDTVSPANPTEAGAWLVSAVSVGAAAGAALVGVLIGVASASASCAIPLAALLLAAAVLAAFRKSLTLP